MAHTLRISALQLAAHDRDAFSIRREHILRVCAQSAASCDLLVLPESTFPAYVLGDADIDDAQVEDALTAMRQIAREHACTIVAGVALRQEGVLYNSAVAIDRDGSLAGVADKAFLWHFDRKWFAPAETLAPVATSVGKLGLFVCADGRMPGIARALVDRGAEMLVMPTAWVTGGRDPSSLENVQADLLARVRAFENNVVLVAANKCGTERGMVAYCGKSQIVANDGNVVALAGEQAEVAISATMNIAAPRPFRSIPLDASVVNPGSERRIVRIAISIDPLPADIDARLRLLDSELALAPGYAAGIEELARIVPTVSLEAMRAYDPGALVAARLAGAQVAILDAAAHDPWLERIARARALELRMYIVVFDRGRERAYAIDPDGAVIAGTFGDYRLAGFAFDARRTHETAVAPGTDILEGMRRIEILQHTRSELQ